MWLARHKRGPRFRGTGTAVGSIFPRVRPPQDQAVADGDDRVLASFLRIEERVPEKGTRPEVATDWRSARRGAG